MLRSSFVLVFIRLRVRARYHENPVSGGLNGFLLPRGLNLFCKVGSRCWDYWGQISHTHGPLRGE
jgi:hypothetical protein